jgi:threonine/homoserine/homoserine lactone efflux protein
METNLLVAFVGVSIAVIVIPGPSILLIVSNSLQQGTAAGLYTVAGVSAAMFVQLLIVLAGFGSVVTWLAPALDIIRWLGIVYLCYLGIRRWRSDSPGGLFDAHPSREYGSAFVEGCMVALTNPATLLFFIAFFPQFLDGAAPPGRQFMFMAVIFWLLALVFDLAYAGFAARLGMTLQESHWVRLRNHLSGAIMVAAAAALAIANI